MNDVGQLELIKIGILIGIEIPDINIDAFETLEDLRLFLVADLGLHIEVGTLYTDIIEELEK